MKDSTRVLLALAIGVGGGIAIAASHNASLLSVADSIAPIGTMWVNAIAMTVIPLVVSLLITGVASATDVIAIGRLGGRTLLTFVGLSAALAIIVIPSAAALSTLLPQNFTHPPLPPGALQAADEATSNQEQTLAAWLISLIPRNPIAAAAS